MKPVVLHEISVDAAAPAVLAELDHVFYITIRTETNKKSFSSSTVSTVTPAALQGCSQSDFFVGFFWFNMRTRASLTRCRGMLNISDVAARLIGSSDRDYGGA